MKKISRKNLLKDVKRVVVKVGSGVLTGKNGLNMTVINNLAADIYHLLESGIEVVLVSSGAIASGMKKIGLRKRPQSVSQQQALAAIGQCNLMMTYQAAFEHYDQKVAQILLTRDDLTHRRRYLNARNTLFTLLAWKVLPIINENDTVVADEIKFGDNDNLGAMVTNLTESQMLINLTDIDGLFDKDPRTDRNARMIGLVEKIDRKVMRYAGSIPGFLGTGGMASKIRAAHKVALGGGLTVIANGLRQDILKKIFSGEEVGTLFMPQDPPLCNRKHWIAFAKSPKGILVIDKGAETAIVRQGRSLLPAGIKEVRGRFSLGNSVKLINEENNEVAVGMVNYHSGEIRKIMGARTTDIESILGFKHYDEIIHRDNLVLMSQMEKGDALCH